MFNMKSWNAVSETIQNIIQKIKMGVSDWECVCVRERITYLWLRRKSEIDMVACLDDNFK